jgi:peroxiredoxin
MVRRFIWLLLCLGLGIANAQHITLTGTKGERIYDNQLIGGKATVFYFLSPECPLCQSYVLTIKQLYQTFANQGVQMVGIIPGTDFSNTTISTFKHRYGLPIPLWKDEELKLTNKYNATITPEVVVVNAKGKVLYQGRIDNWAYELAKKRRVITEHNLRDALNSIVHNQPIKITKTKAVGCYIE